MVNVMVERATNEFLIGPDWSMNLEICDKLNRDPLELKDVIKGIKKKLGSKNSKVQLLTLTLLETLMKNCGDKVHLLVAERDVLHDLVKIVKKKPEFNVKGKILVLIDTWQEAFGGPRARYPQYYTAYQELLRAGAVFPQRSESEAPVLTPLQTQPLSTYPPNVRNSDFLQEAPGEPSSQPQLSTLSVTEIQNARVIMDVLSEMLSALNPGNKEGLKQEVIVELVEQCRTYKDRVVQFVTNTSDETLMFQGLALSDDLDRLLEKHDAIAAGAPLRVEQSLNEAIQDLLIDTGVRSNQADQRRTSTSVPEAQSEPPLFALPPPSTNTSAPPSVKLDPKTDLLSGDDYNSPRAQNNLVLVPVEEAHPVSPLSQGNATSSSSGAQPSYLTGQTQSRSTMPVNQQPYHSSSQPMQYANGTLLSELHNPQSSHSLVNETGSVRNAQNYVALDEQSSESFAWNGQQQQPPPSVNGQHDSSFPPPPWETELDEINIQAAAQSLDMNVHTQVQHTVPYVQQNDMYPPGEHVVNNVYMQPAGSQHFQNNQYAGMLQPGQLYPQQMYSYQVQGYGSYGQQQDPRLVQQKMIGLSMTGNNVGMMNSNPYPTSSALSYSSASKNPEDKLFGDLVDISKFKSAKSSAG